MSKPKIVVKEVELDSLADNAVDELVEALKLPSEAADALRQAVKERGPKVPKKLESIMEANAQLIEYLGIEEPKVGDLVVRNRFGTARYRFPNSDDAEAAIVIDVWNERRSDDDNRGTSSGVIAVTDRDGLVRTYTVDLRCYEKTEYKSTNGTIQ